MLHESEAAMSNILYTIDVMLMTTFILVGCGALLLVFI